MELKLLVLRVFPSLNQYGASVVHRHVPDLGDTGPGSVVHHTPEVVDCATDRASSSSEYEHPAFRDTVRWWCYKGGPVSETTTEKLPPILGVETLRPGNVRTQTNRRKEGECTVDYGNPLEARGDREGVSVV